ncbi:hypothetical protein [Shewanella decolorationis]|uniref:Uncharacterized protein n=1 Tax=Shewanella decolorationis TaxID=256839 RepID=A0A8A9LGK2_9GAMM|nr:hypothetical protein [Shewanella decolorationis]
MTESKSKGLPDEPFGQHLAGVSAALSSVYVEHYTARTLPCIKTSQIAAKITLKRQHALSTMLF